MTAPRESSWSHSTETAAAVLDRPKILCIDDDPDVSYAIELRLREFEVRVLRAFHGMQGFWLAMTERPDVIITDIRMPQGQGDYVVECLKRNAETCDIPVLVLSGRRDERIRHRMLQLGVERYFTKPCPLDELVEGIQSFVELRPVEE